jgi:hypothetical protein
VILGFLPERHEQVDDSCLTMPSSR